MVLLLSVTCLRSKHGVLTHREDRLVTLLVRGRLRVGTKILPITECPVFERLSPKVYSDFERNIYRDKIYPENSNTVHY